MAIKVLVADDDRDMRSSIVAVLDDAGYKTIEFADGGAVVKYLSSNPPPDLMVLDVSMPVLDGLGVTKFVKGDPNLRFVPILLLTGKDQLDDVLAGFDAGADDYLVKPCRQEELVARIRAALRIRILYQEIAKSEAETEALREALRGNDSATGGFGELLGSAAVMRDVFSLIERVAVADVPVLIRGESGTGKELVAREIHNRSDRSKGPYIAQNCAAFQDQLLESALFGHMRGAFTGAVRDKAGLFQVAHGGTFFLDEVGELSLALQAKLLRVLQEGTFTPVGDTRERKVDVRIVAATHRPLEEMIQRHEFREDLFYRLEVVPVVIPPLRERSEDVPLLAQTFLERICARRRLKLRQLSSESVEALSSYQWPGNVRQLQNEMERAIIVAGDTTLISLAHLSLGRGMTPARPTQSRASEVDSSIIGGTLRDASIRMEREVIGRALIQAAGNKSEAARILGISRSTLIAKVQEYEL